MSIKAVIAIVVLYTAMFTLLAVGWKESRSKRALFWRRVALIGAGAVAVYAASVLFHLLGW